VLTEHPGQLYASGVLIADSDRVYATRPEWATGHISRRDARFLFRRLLETAPGVVIEIGTATGVSTAIICHGAKTAAAAGKGPADFEVHTYDISTRFYANREKRVGDAAREMLDSELLEHVSFHAPATAATVREQHSPDSIEFAFIDAAHKHPWPVLDLIAMLTCLRPGADVLLHDINLPQLTEENKVFGAHLLYEGLDVEKEADDGAPIPNIGRIRIPDDKAKLREELLALMDAHEWEVEPQPEQIRVALA
jgi:predicted O-methyltransferase YrrM